MTTAERLRETEQLIMEDDSKKGKRTSNLMKVDNRIRILIENGVAKQHRSMFVIVGDRGKDQVCHTSSFIMVIIRIIMTIIIIFITLLSLQMLIGDCLLQCHRHRISHM